MTVETGNALQMHPHSLEGLAGSHDLRLSSWGAFTKRYMGISHVPRVSEGLRFDLSAFPVLYRRGTNLPNAWWESGFHMWQAAPDHSFFSVRYELIWKDELYADVAFCRLDEQRVLVRSELVNRSELPQTLALHYMASFHFPPLQPYRNDVLHPWRVELPEGALWVDGLSYQSLSTRQSDPQATLTPDAFIRGQVRDHGFVGGNGVALGLRREGAKENPEGEDAIRYALSLSQEIADAVLLLRYRMQKSPRARVALSGIAQAAAQEVVLEGGDGEFMTQQVPLGRIGAGELELTFTLVEGDEVQLDGFALAAAGQVQQVHFAPVVWNPVPERVAGPRPDSFLLKYEQAPGYYGVSWGYKPYQVREFFGEDLDWIMRRWVHDHVHEVFRSPGEGHFTNVFMRPVFLEPNSSQVVYGLVCTGERQAVERQLAEFDPASSRWEKEYEEASKRACDLACSPQGERYRFSQERMAATVLTNTVYPVHTRGTYIRHYSPGRWWDSLYTWDAGFIGLGLTELDLDRAIDCLNAYVTEPGDRDSAFIHHGSPVPVQLYVFLELWNRTRSRELLEYFYPRVRQYHRFLAGRLGSSTTRSLASNLLCTWDYFYNSGGWDDYPPQVHVHEHNLTDRVAPSVNTSHAIRTAKILRMAAVALGEPTAEYDEDIQVFSRALQSHAWDEESGYFSYVCHDEAGHPTGILRHESGVNFDMGFDGVTPLVAGICTPDQEEKLCEHLMDPKQLWCRYGLTTVDQSASYFRSDGYWNGAVWMAHQWFFWKALLGAGRAEQAWRIAQTALELWKREVDASYNCYEHFMMQNGRGAGWHQFGALSSPVLNWYSAYYRPGRFTTGLDTWIESLDVEGHARALTATLHCFGRASTAIVTLEPAKNYTATWNGEPITWLERQAGAVEVTLPAGECVGQLSVKAL